MKRNEDLNYAIEKRPFQNNAHCGDACACWESDEKITMLTVDGLGHGRDAEIAAKAAVEYVDRYVAESIRDIFSGCDHALRPTRGAAMGLAVIDKAENTITYAGIGNTRALLMGTSTIRFSSNYGILGTGFRKLVPETRPIHNGSLIILFTDGIDEMIDLFDYPGDTIQDPKALANKIIEDWGRDTDDAAVMVYKYE